MDNFYIEITNTTTGIKESISIIGYDITTEELIRSIRNVERKNIQLQTSDGDLENQMGMGEFSVISER